MTKNWEDWKDEIKRLYKTKSLHKVRGILQAKGLDASIRAYRMKLDGWGIRKNSSAHIPKKRRIELSSLSDTARVVRENEATLSSIGNIHPIRNYSTAEWASQPNANSVICVKTRLEAFDCRSPRPYLKVDTLLRCFAEEALHEDLPEILLLNWQSDGTYLKVALRYLDETETLVLFENCVLIKDMFCLIDAKVGPYERSKLTRSILNSLCCLRPWATLSEHSAGSWATLLDKILKTSSWQGRKRLIMLSTETKSFDEFASIATAEELLHGFRFTVDRMMQKDAEPEFETSAFLAARSRYIEILNDFNDAKPGLDLDPRYYKFALCMGIWYEQRQTDQVKGISDKFKVVQRELSLLKEECSAREPVDISNGFSLGNESGSIDPPLILQTSVNLDFHGIPNEVRLLLDLLRTDSEKERFLMKVRQFDLSKMLLKNQDTIPDLEIPGRGLYMLLEGVQPSHRSQLKNVLFQTFEHFVILSDNFEQSVIEKK